MNYDTEAYEAAVSQWFEELKDIVVNDLLWQHINKYPVKSDFEIKEEVKKEPKINWISDWSEEQIEEWRKKNTNEG